MNCVRCDLCVYHLGLFVFFPRVFLSSRVTGACPVTTDLIMRVNVRTTTTTTEILLHVSWPFSCFLKIWFFCQHDFELFRDFFFLFVYSSHFSLCLFPLLLSVPPPQVLQSASVCLPSFRTQNVYTCSVNWTFGPHGWHHASRWIDTDIGNAGCRLQQCCSKNTKNTVEYRLDHIYLQIHCL